MLRSGRTGSGVRDDDADQPARALGPLGLRVFPHFYGDHCASGNPGLAIDPDPISEVLIVPVEEAFDLLHSGFFRFDLAAVPIAC
jgi:hypothetical protein